MSDKPEMRYIPASSPRSSQDEAARQLPKRFYKLAAVAPHSAGFAIELDGRVVKTPKRAPLVVPTARLAAAIAGEWNDLADTIDPQKLPLTKIANTAIDGVIGREQVIHDDIVRYIGNDLLCYRAAAPAALAARQAAAWDPVLEWFEETYAATFKVTTGIMPIEQNLVSVAKAASALTRETGMSLAPLHVMTTLTGSALLTIAYHKGHVSAEQVWHATHVDEDWQIENWGPDSEAEVRRIKRHDELQAAVHFLTSLRD